MNDHLPPPPPGVPGRDTPPPYRPPTPSWSQPPPSWPPVAGVPTMELREDPPKPPARAHLFFLAVALVGVGMLVGTLIGGGDGSDDGVEATAASTVASSTTVRPTTTTTVYRTTTTAAPSLSDREIQELALDMTWADASYSDQQDICTGVELFGIEYAASLIIEGADGSFDADIVERKLAEWCNTY